MNSIEERCDACNLTRNVFLVQDFPKDIQFTLTKHYYYRQLCKNCIDKLMSNVTEVVGKDEEDLKEEIKNIEKEKRALTLIPNFLQTIPEEKRLNADEVIDFLENSKEETREDWRSKDIILIANRYKHLRGIGSSVLTSSANLSRFVLCKPFKSIKVLFLGSTAGNVLSELINENTIFNDIRKKGYKIIVFKSIFTDTYAHSVKFDFKRTSTAYQFVPSLLDTSEVSSQLTIMNIKFITFDILYKVVSVIQEK